MNPSRSLILAVLLLGATHATAQDTSAGPTWYYQESSATPPQYTVPAGYSVCPDGHTAASRVNDQTFTVAPMGADGRKLSVLVGATCKAGDPAQSVRLVILPGFSSAVTGAVSAYYVEPGGAGPGQFLLTFDGLSVSAPEVQKLWALRPLNFSAGQGEWTTATLGGSVAYRFEGSVEALPTNLDVGLVPAGAPAGARVLDTAGQPVTLARYTFDKWRFAESDLKSTIRVSGAHAGPSKVTWEIPAPLLRLTRSPTTAEKGAAPCHPGARCLASPGAVGAVTWTVSAADLAAATRFFLLLENNRVYVGNSSQSSLSVEVMRDECSYEVVPLTPLFAGFRDTRLYLRLIGYKDDRVEPSCIDPNTFRRWLVQASGFEVSTGQSLEGFSLSRGALTGLKVGALPSDVLVLPIARVLADAGGQATLRLAFADDSSNTRDIKLRRGAFPIQLAVTTPPPFAGPVRVEVREPHDRKSSAPWQDWELIGTGLKDLAVGRNNLLFFEAADLDAWRLQLLSLHVRPCEGEVWQSTNPQLKGVAGVFCVVPQRETDDTLAFRAFYRPSAKDSLSVLADLPTEVTVDFGYQEVKTTLRSKPQRHALDLKERVSVRCENTRAGVAERSVTSLAPEYQPNAVVVSAFSGPRAVPAEDLDHCKVIVSLRRNGIGEAPEDKGPLELRTEALELLRAVGEQSLSISAEILPKKQEDKPSNLFSKTLKLRNRDDLEVVNGTVEVPILLQKSGSIKLEDYSVVRVSVKHTSEGDYVAGDDSFPTSHMDADLRRMPEYFAGRIVRGVGPRAFFTIEIPTGLVRWPGSGYEATSSTSHRRLEAAVFGIGALAVLEAYDFDNAKQFLAFNPQLHAGVLLSTVPKAGIPPPRLSLVTGLAVRFPSSIKLPASIESGLATVFWVEWGNRARGNWEPAFLFGFSVNVGSFPN
ncbi:hypothetical protein HPC49_21320 [Pyxidicoccus fallax]|uniref:Lipoprotein n=1 Tax=Pyxidicoccus fallax TaxID=394095 RepID=A0A848LQV2_9BACT|nr:hypothetical protein [Pyxidicoccus fallax]NMO20020.1 hypothetical protein [Pyxidicoccus fallax]NPC80754.1 hypothetical protein [Pyxidicoccus fallax]